MFKLCPLLAKVRYGLETGCVDGPLDSVRMASLTSRLSAALLPAALRTRSRRGISNTNAIKLSFLLMVL